MPQKTHPTKTKNHNYPQATFKTATTNTRIATSNIQKTHPHLQQQPNKPQTTTQTKNKTQNTTAQRPCAHKTIQQQPKRNKTVVTDQLHDAAQFFENQVGKGTKSMLEMPPRKNLQVLLTWGAIKFPNQVSGDIPLILKKSVNCLLALKKAHEKRV